MDSQNGSNLGIWCDALACQMEGRNRKPRKFVPPNRPRRIRLNHIPRCHRDMKLAARRLPCLVCILFGQPRYLSERTSAVLVHPTVALDFHNSCTVCRLVLSKHRVSVMYVP